MAHAGSGGSLTRDQWNQDSWIWIVKFGEYWFSSEKIDLDIDGDIRQVKFYVEDISLSTKIDYKSLNFEYELAVSLMLSEESRSLLKRPLTYNLCSAWIVSKEGGWDERVPIIENAKINNPQYTSQYEPISFSCTAVETENEDKLPYIYKIGDFDASFLYGRATPEKSLEQTTNLIWGKLLGTTPCPVVDCTSSVLAGGAGVPVAGFSQWVIDREVVVAGHELDTSAVLSWIIRDSEYDYVNRTSGTQAATFETGLTLLEPTLSPVVTMPTSWGGVDVEDIDTVYVVWDGTLAGLGEDYGGYDAASCIKFLLGHINDSIDWADLNQQIEPLKQFELGFWANDPDDSIINFVNDNFQHLGCAISYTGKGLSVIVRPKFLDIKKNWQWSFEENKNCALSSAITEENADIITDVVIEYGKTFTGFERTKITAEHPIYDYRSLFSELMEPEYEEGTIEESSAGTINASYTSQNGKQKANVKKITSAIINSESTASQVAGEIFFWEGRPTIKLALDVIGENIAKYKVGDVVKYINDDLDWEKYGYISSISFGLDFAGSVELTLLDL